MSSFRLLVVSIGTTARWRFTLLLVLATTEGVLAPVITALTGHVVAVATDTAVTAGQLLPPIALIGGLFGIAMLLGPARNALGADIGSRVAHRLALQVFDATMAPAGIAHLEDPQIADQIRRGADIEWDLAPMTRIVTELGRATTMVVGALGAAVLLSAFAWWAPILLLISILLTHRWMGNEEEDQIRAREDYAAIERRANYYHDLALDPPAAKEIRLFGLVGFLADRTRRHRLEFLSHLWQARRLRRGPILATVGAIAVAHVLVLGAMVRAALDGSVDAGAVAVYVQAVGAIAVLGHGTLELWWVRQGAAALPHLRDLPERTGWTGALPSGTARTSAPREAIRFQNVSFTYPGTERPVLAGLDLELRVGESTAIVGENGAGKSTLLKLLSRLYDPTAGSVTVDGRDLRDFRPDSWRTHVAVISQSFIRYEATALDNVAFGSRRDGPVEEAAELAGAGSVIESLPAGWDTILSRRYAGGVDLSGGQWQRIALARALHAARTGARILVLDEPSANLDVRAEAALFDRFLELTAGLTTVLVTHRLSTVRYADRIVVLGGGRVRESGTHADLVTAGGDYAAMFGLQAERFRAERFRADRFRATEGFDHG